MNRYLSKRDVFFFSFFMVEFEIGGVLYGCLDEKNYSRNDVSAYFDRIFDPYVFFQNC